MTVRILQGDCRETLRLLADGSIDACVCDPPYHLTEGKKGGSGAASHNPASPGGRARIGTGFMGTAWDGGDVANRVETWAEVFRVLKPGAHLLAFGGTRTYHRMACAIEDAGFEIRDCIRNEQGQESWLGWLYGSGFPKSLNAAKAIDKLLGRKGKSKPVGKAVRRVRPGAQQNGTGSWEKLEDRGYQPHAYEPASAEAAAWQGWGTALKPAWEPILVARKPLDGTVAANLLDHGCGGLNIEACRVPFAGADDEKATKEKNQHRDFGSGAMNNQIFGRYSAARENYDARGRWPASVIHDGSDGVEAAFAAFGERNGGHYPSKRGNGGISTGGHKGQADLAERKSETGSAARFFYAAKANKHDRAGSKHPTVKPIALMRYLVRLVTPPGGVVLDPFAGSGTTGEAAHLEQFDAVLCELLPDHVADIRRRLARVECNITEGLRDGVAGSGVNITPPKAVHNKHYVALGAST